MLVVCWPEMLEGCGVYHISECCPLSLYAVLIILGFVWHPVIQILGKLLCNAVVIQLRDVEPLFSFWPCGLLKG